MGPVGRRLYLPAPTDSLIDSAAEDTGQASEDIGTDLSVRTDQTHHTIPDDFSPITIATNKVTGKHSRGNNSQTSLLIEYFEGEQDENNTRRPSVRVRVNPSRKSANKKEHDAGLLSNRTSATAKPTYTRRISLGSKDGTSSKSAGDPGLTGRSRTTPLDTHIGRRDSDMSEFSASPEARYIPASSDISSMPADSMLGAPISTLPPNFKQVEESNVSSLPAEGSVLSEHENTRTSTLKPPIMPAERNLSNERIASKVIEKLSAKPRMTSSHRRSEKSSSRSSRDVEAVSGTRHRSSAKQFRDEDSELSPSDPSVLSASAVSGDAKSLGERSNRSGISTASITNPRLLQTVEDVVRRLILPELKELKKDQRHTSHRSKYDSYSDVSESSIVREKGARRSTSGSKSRRRTSKDSTDATGTRRKASNHEQRGREVDYDSFSDTSSRRNESLSSISLEDQKSSRRKHKDHHARDLAAAGLLGAGLTAAALHHNDPDENAHRRRRRRRSKSRSSHSVSVADSEEVFQKHEVPPMPLQSDVGTDVTRSSLLSSNTASTATPGHHEVRQVARGVRVDDQEELSPEANTPPRFSGDLRQVLGTHHGNFSETNLSAQRLAAFNEMEEQEALSPETERYDPYHDEPLEDPERMKLYERNLHTQHPIRRGLSPIQSVASYATTEPHRNSMMQARSYDSIASMKRRQQQLKEEVSMDSFMSASPDLRKPKSQGSNLEGRNVAIGLYNSPGKSPGLARRLDYGTDERREYGDLERPNARAPGSRELPKDAAADRQYVDKVTAGQNVTRVVGAVPEYVNTPPGVESAVASLIEPSLLDIQGSQGSASDLHKQQTLQSESREIEGAGYRSPLREQMASPTRPSLVGRSPPQSPARSYEHEDEQLQVQTQPESPAMNFQQGEDQSPESEIVTNPSIIRGPMGGVATANLAGWNRQTATPPHSGQTGFSRDFTPGATDLIPEGLNVSQRPHVETKPGTYIIGQPIPTPPGNKDEGYVTGDNYPSPGPIPKEAPRAPRAPPDLDYTGGMDDPFVSKNKQYMSGLSQGMSPLYDSAKGQGMDRIQSQDIVALMNHLTVRDAQRNARDSEILMHLVKSAAEMRNSFEEMRTFISEQDEALMQESEKQHAQTRTVGGPRALPPSAKSAQRPEMSEEDLPTKRKNIFKRALAGLGSKNTAELQNIEGMLMQLLDEVEALRSQQSFPTSLPAAGSAQNVRNVSGGSAEQGRAATDSGYEPEGRAGTSSTIDQAGLYSSTSSRQGQHSAVRQMPDNRVSTVMEGDEEYDDYDDDQYTPRAGSPADNEYARHTRGQSLPLGTPPRAAQQAHDSLSNERNPRTISFNNSAERKHKSFASSFMPKMISRWSKTTASTMPDTPNARGPNQAQTRPYSQISRSGSDLHEYQYENDPGDRLRSRTSLQDEQARKENRPPSPLVPSNVSAEHPKYEGYRNSINLQHPQPRQGPTGRYQYTLESAAQTYHHPDETFSPASQTSYTNRPWSNTQPAQSNQAQQYRPQGALSPISSHAGDNNSEYSDDFAYGPPYNPTPSKAAPPQRPPKVPNDEPLVPQRPPKLPMSPSTYVDHVAAARAGSPAFDKSPMSAIRNSASPQSGRRPSGPRAMGTLSPTVSGAGAGKRARFNSSPLQVDSEGEQY